MCNVVEMGISFFSQLLILRHTLSLQERFTSRISYSSFPTLSMDIKLLKMFQEIGDALLIHRVTAGLRMLVSQ
jgi:hypothetical protein